jgi:hypothetical protein
MLPIRVLFAWRLASGFAHGRLWPHLMDLDVFVGVAGRQ